MRLIDADALKGQIRETIKVYKTNGEFDEPLKRFCNMLRQEIKAIDNAPTIDAEPVKHGEWVPCTKNGLILNELIRAEDVAKWYGFKCSECNYIHKGNALIEYNFCPNCGAKMDKD